MAWWQTRNGKPAVKLWKPDSGDLWDSLLIEFQALWGSSNYTGGKATSNVVLERAERSLADENASWTQQTFLLCGVFSYYTCILEGIHTVFINVIMST